MRALFLKIDQVRFFEYVLWVILALALIARVLAIFFLEVNWDEFFFLEHIYAHSRGDFIPAMHTIYVHAFKWLPLVSNNEVEQIIAARLVMVPFQLLTAWFLYKACRLFYSKNAGLFALACYFSFHFVLLCGHQFRDDPMAACFLMGALYCLLAYPRSYFYALIAGVSTGVAAMLVMKSIFYMPTFGVILLASFLREHNSMRVMWRSVFFAVVTVLCMGGLYLIHSATLHQGLDVNTYSTIADSFNRSISFDYISRTVLSVMYSFIYSPFFGLCVGFGVFAVWWSRKQDVLQAVIVLSMGLPLLSLFFYAHIFLYYYVFLLPPVAVLCAATWHFLEKEPMSRERLVIAIILLFGMTYDFTVYIGRTIQDRTLAAQYTFLSGVHTIFKSPVPYLDRCGMVSSFPWSGFFMSSWGLDNYRFVSGMTEVSNNAIPEPWGGAKAFADIIRERQPKFVVANIVQLDVDRVIYPPDAPERITALSDQDKLALQNNFLPFWGGLYLAGKRILFAQGEPESAFEIVIEGPYTLRAKNTVFIDGQTYFPDDVVYLKVGIHKIKDLFVQDKIELFWGENLQKPSYPAPQNLLFGGR